MASVLEIIPLGGIGEFGMNCMAVRYGDEMLILDAGMGFPEESAYGVDVSIPNFGFLDEYRDDITAIPSNRIAATQVVATFVEGRCTHGAEAVIADS